MRLDPHHIQLYLLNPPFFSISNTFQMKKKFLLFFTVILGMRRCHLLLLCSFLWSKIYSMRRDMKCHVYVFTFLLLHPQLIFHAHQKNVFSQIHRWRVDVGTQWKWMTVQLMMINFRKYWDFNLISCHVSVLKEKIWERWNGNLRCGTWKIKNGERNFCHFSSLYSLRFYFSCH